MGLGMNSWDWEGMGMLQAIPAHLYSDLISSANRFYRPLCGPRLMTFDPGIDR